MILESKLKQAALLTALDISLKRIKKSPERCARNLMELGISTYPGKISKKDYDFLMEKLLLLCKNNDTQGVRDFFIKTFFTL